MKRFKLVIMASILGLFFTACSTNAENMANNERPNNIDKNNVGITQGETLDQSDPSIIEGNLENNDFKN